MLNAIVQQYMWMTGIEMVAMESGVGWLNALGR
jgi:hypothetical protein